MNQVKDSARERPAMRAVRHHERWNFGETPVRRALEFWDCSIMSSASSLVRNVVKGRSSLRNHFGCGSVAKIRNQTTSKVAIDAEYRDLMHSFCIF